jgi:hypothetical protein
MGPWVGGNPRILSQPTLGTMWAPPRHLSARNQGQVEDRWPGKALVLLQVSWMILQTIGRVATHIPTLLLEVNIIGHILCAFVMYLS